MIMARSQVQHTKYTVLLSVLMYFLLLRAFSFFFSLFCNPRLPDVLCWPPGITVLLSLTVFMLMVAEIMPATSDSVPLIGQGFFFFDCMCICMSVLEILRGDNPVYSQQISSKVSHVFQVSISPAPW